MNKAQMKIKKAAILGAGAMGSKIAALLAGVDIPTCLLDIVPKELDDKDLKKRLTRESPEFRNKLARLGIDYTLMASPPAFFVAQDTKLIKPGNFEDHLAWLSEADWIIEVVAEDLNIKKALLRKVEPHMKPTAILTTNTSGLSVNMISEDLSEQTRAHFLGTHFFNPPRHMKLIEIIPGKLTDEATLSFMADFCEVRLGKSIVFAKDTPNFIANRIGAHAMLAAIKIMLEDGYTIEEVDAITATPMGRPKMASFRTADMVGLDVFAKVAQNVGDNVNDATEKKAFAVPEFVARMVQTGLLGDKTQKGFYKKVTGAQGSQIFAIDCTTMDYVPVRKTSLPALDELKQVDDPAKRLRALAYSDDRAGRYAWKVLKKMLLYCASKVPEISDDIVSIDRAMRWGFNWELGPFETWDALGLRESVERMEKEGEKIPANIGLMLSVGKERFYEKRRGKGYYFDFAKLNYAKIEEKAQLVLLPSPDEKRKKVVRANAGARLVDIGEGVACLEFRSPNNVIDGDVIQMLHDAMTEVEENFEGLVIGNRGANFCPGADVKLIYGLAMNKDWKTLEQAVAQLQQALMRMKYSEKPVVAAPFRMALGGGCEVCLAASMVRAHAEAYLGLVEMGVGLIPAGGGTKEMLLRATDWVPPSIPSAAPGGAKPDLIPYVARAFETIATARVSTSAREAQGIGYMTPHDRITMNLDYLLYDAKESVLSLVREGYRPPRPRDDIRVVGRTGRGILDLMVFLLKDAGHISEADAHIAGRLAYVITGGDLDQNVLVTEQYLLDLEREVFLSLSGEEKTQARLKHMIETGRPLRN